jgi:3-dehydroquinate synthase
MIDSIDASFSIEWTHRLRFAQRAFDVGNEIDTLIEELQPVRILAVLDKGLADTNPEFIEVLDAWREREERVCGDVLVLPGGEDSKNDLNAVNSVLESIDKNGICRRSCILVIGGGAVLDAVGFSSSIGHRGIPLIRVPSTTLSQGDSGVGVKNGVNLFGKKNFIGVFDPPFAVVNDSTLLKSLPDKHWRAGLSEAVKVALIKDTALFEEIERNADALLQRDTAKMNSVLQKSATLHLHHITNGGDPFERLEARPLDFGHWAAHKLEQLADFQISHGDAVAIGLAVDIRCSVALGLLENEIAERIISLLQKLGFPTSHQELKNPILIDGIEEFRQHLGGTLTLLMLEGFEQPIDIHALDVNIVRQAIEKLM